MTAGWSKKLLNEICNISTGRWDANHATENGNFRFYTCAFRHSYCDTKRFSGECLVLPGNGVNVGEVFYFNGEFDAYQRTYVISNIQSDAKFLFYHLFAFWKERNLNKQFGSATNFLKIGNFNNYVVSLPTLQEQQRIVVMLDQAFEGIAKARANAEQNLQNARALFESHLQSVFSDAAHNNDLVALSDLATDIMDGDHMPPPKAITGVPFITIGNIVKDTRTIDFTDTFKVPAEYFNKLKANKKPKLGDVLYTVTGSFGIPVLVKGNQEFCFQRHIGLIRPKSDVSSEWLCYLLSSPQLLKQANDGATGTAQKTVSLKVLRGFQVPRLSLENQKKIVVELDTLSKETQRLEALYQRKIALLDELKKSLLQQAFAGEL